MAKIVTPTVNWDQLCTCGSTRAWHGASKDSTSVEGACERRYCPCKRKTDSRCLAFTPLLG